MRRERPSSLPSFGLLKPPLLELLRGSFQKGFFHKRSLKSLTELDNHVLGISDLHTWPLEKEIPKASKAVLIATNKIFKMSKKESGLVVSHYFA